jgi:hypothetical protein
LGGFLRGSDTAMSECPGFWVLPSSDRFDFVETGSTFPGGRRERRSGKGPGSRHPRSYSCIRYFAFDHRLWLPLR